MGLVGSLAWVNNYSKKQCWKLFWRMRAAVKKKAGKKKCKFQYDPWSYALNFDDGGGCSVGEEVENGPFQKGEVVVLQGFSGATVWVYVIVECSTCTYKLTDRFVQWYQSKCSTCTYKLTDRFVQWYQNA